jgi:hypothetical protein
MSIEQKQMKVESRRIPESRAFEDEFIDLLCEEMKTFKMGVNFCGGVTYLSACVSTTRSATTASHS